MNAATADYAQAAAAMLADGKLDANDLGTAASTALQGLGGTMDAAGAAGSSPLGELLELVVSKVKFLQQPLEKLMGSPEAVEAQSQLWQSVAGDFREAGQDYSGGSQDLPHWLGQSATTYQQLSGSLQPIFEAAAVGAEAMGRAVVALGEMVAIVRKTIWDILAQWLGTVVQSALSALAAAVPTFGSSIAAFGAWFIGKTVSLAKRFFTMLAKLLAKGKEVAKALKEESAKLDEARRNLTAMTTSLNQGGRQLTSPVRVAPA